MSHLKSPVNQVEKATLAYLISISFCFFYLLFLWFLLLIFIDHSRSGASYSGDWRSRRSVRLLEDTNKETHDENSIERYNGNEFLERC